MNKRLLILCDPYGKPSFGPRVRYLSDYLCRQGWTIEVYTEAWDRLCFEHAYPIEEIALYRGERGSRLYQLDWMVKSAWSLLTDWKNRAFCRKVKKRIADKQYDAVFCTTFSTFPLPAALSIAQERQIPLICDLRDIDEQVGGAQYQHHRQWWARPFRQAYRDSNIHRRNRVLRNANAITTVSPWHVDFLKQFNPYVALIYNGYNPTIHYFEAIPSDRFTISYMGRLYGATSQDPSLLMEALGTIASEMPELELLIHTDPQGQQRFKQMAQAYGITHICRISGYVDIDTIPQLYRESSICVVLSNKATDDGPKGMMTTKFFEIVGTEKPLLLVRSDEAHLAQAVEQTNAGLAAVSTDEVIAFIREKYQEWKQNGYTHQPVRREVVRLFNRETESAQFEEILTGLLSND